MFHNVNLCISQQDCLHSIPHDKTFCSLITRKDYKYLIKCTTYSNFELLHVESFEQDIPCPCLLTVICILLVFVLFLASSIFQAYQNKNTQHRMFRVFGGLKKTPWLNSEKGKRSLKTSFPTGSPKLYER